MAAPTTTDSGGLNKSVTVNLTRNESKAVLSLSQSTVACSEAGCTARLIMWASDKSH